MFISNPYNCIIKNCSLTADLQVCVNAVLPGALEEWCISTSLPPLPLSLAVRSVDVSLLLSWEPFIKLFCKTYKVQIYLHPFHALIKACCNQGLDKNIPQLYFCFYAFYQTDLQNVSSIKQIYISHI